MKKSESGPNFFRRRAIPLFLKIALLTTLSGCASFMHGTAALSGGGGGSSCEFGGLFRGSECVDVVVSVFLSDTSWRERPTVCGYIYTSGVFGKTTWRPEGECFDNLPAYCQSDVLVPGFDNQTVKLHGATIVAEYEKKRMCSIPMTAELFLYKYKRAESEVVVVWGRAVFRDDYGRETRIEKPGEDVVTYCRSNILVPEVDERKLVDYGIIKEAVRQKAALCKDAK